MTYRVVYTDPFVADIDNHIDYLLGQGVSVETITAWYDKLYERLDALDDMPKRLPVDERMTALTGRESRTGELPCRSRFNTGELVVISAIQPYLQFYRNMSHSSVVYLPFPLRGKPVVVLSNNDGVIVARSSPAPPLRMIQP